MKLAEEKTLKAFWLALAELEEPWPPAVEKARNAIGDSLARQDEAAATEQIEAIVAQCDRLNQLYREARASLTSSYHSQERAKSSNGTQAVAIEQPVLKKLASAPNFQTAVQETVRHAQRQSDPFLEALALNHSLRKGREQVNCTAILEALEFRPLAVEELAKKLELPYEQTEKLVRQLWQAGKVEKFTSSPFYKIVPLFRNQRQFTPSARLTLTLRGYFHLHPVISLG